MATKKAEGQAKTPDFNKPGAVEKFDKEKRDQELERRSQFSDKGSVTALSSKPSKGDTVVGNFNLKAGE